MAAKTKRRLFFFALVEQIRVIWPILSGVLVIIVGLGLLIGRIEDWRVSEALYFSFVTGLTIGYGDFVPRYLSSRVLAVFIGFILTGLVAAVTVQALRATETDSSEDK